MRERSDNEVAPAVCPLTDDRIEDESQARYDQLSSYQKRKVRRMAKRIAKSVRACRRAFYELPGHIKTELWVQLGVECGKLESPKEEPCSK